jgi:hypothetical protein
MPRVQAKIDDILSEPKDLDVCDRVFVRLVKAIEAVGAKPSREQEFVVVLTWHASGLIGNGGFECLFESGFLDEDDPDFVRTIAAFKTLGLETAASVFVETLAWFPGSKPPRDPSARTQMVRAIQKQERSRAFDRVWEDRRALPKQLAEYIRANKAEIEAILWEYEETRETGARDPLVVDSSWDIGDRPVMEVMSELMPRLDELPPGGVLALVAHHPGDHVGPLGETGVVKITTENWIRQFCGRAGHVLARVEPPCYWIRRRKNG